MDTFVTKTTTMLMKQSIHK